MNKTWTTITAPIGRTSIFTTIMNIGHSKSTVETESSIFLVALHFLSRYFVFRSGGCHESSKLVFEQLLGYALKSVRLKQ